MRNPSRIPPLCNRLAGIWSAVSDQRFGQTMFNLMSAYSAKTGKDIFYAEDEELFKFFEEYTFNNTHCSKWIDKEDV